MERLQELWLLLSLIQVTENMISWELALNFKKESNLMWKRIFKQVLFFQINSQILMKLIINLNAEMVFAMLKQKMHKIVQRTVVA